MSTVKTTKRITKKVTRQESIAVVNTLREHNVPVRVSKRADGTRTVFVKPEHIDGAKKVLRTEKLGKVISKLA